jgi:hypothetical protein
MNKFQSLFAATLAAISLNAFAADWKMVSSTADEQTFIDSQSLIKGTDNIIQVRVLENFARVNNMGPGVYEHMSRFMLMAVDCQAGAVSHQQWSLQASALGTGATVWADNMQNGPAFFRPENGSGYGRVVGTVCHSPVAMQN